MVERHFRCVSNWFMQVLQRERRLGCLIYHSANDCIKTELGISYIADNKQEKTMIVLAKYRLKKAKRYYHVQLQKLVRILVDVNI